jgi:hypothetical protein
MTTLHGQTLVVNPTDPMPAADTYLVKGVKGCTKYRKPPVSMPDASYERPLAAAEFGLSNF